MKKNYITLFFLLQIFIVGAQTWFPSEAEWRYRYWNFDTRVGYVQINVVGNEMMGGIMCKKLHAVRYLENMTVMPPPAWTEDLGFEYVYETNGGDQIFIYANSQFYKLYDFGADIGDTWVVPNTHNDITCTPNTGTVTVTDKGVESVSGQPLKWIELLTNTPGSGARIYGRIYQYIGAVATYFFPDIYPDSTECMVPSDALMAEEIYCYSDNVIGYGTCPATILNAENFNTTDAVLMYVENQELIINVKDVSNLKVQVYNMVGQLITQKEEFSNMVTIDTSKFSDGIYVVNVLVNNNEIVKKIKL